MERFRFYVPVRLIRDGAWATGEGDMRPSWWLQAFVPTSASTGRSAFNLTGEIALLLSEADRALAELKGSTRTLPTPISFVACM